MELKRPLYGLLLTIFKSVEDISKMVTLKICQLIQITQFSTGYYEFFLPASKEFLLDKAGSRSLYLTLKLGFILDICLH